MRNRESIFDLFDDVFGGLDPLRIFNTDFFNNQTPRQVLELSAAPFPPANIFITPAKDFVIEVAMAGVRQDQVALDLEGRTLVLSIDKALKEDEADPREGWYKVQGGIKDFTSLKTSFNIPRQYDLSSVKAKVENGLLTVLINPTEETKRLDEKRSIAIGDQKFLEA